jgi:hypothetical protein
MQGAKSPANEFPPIDFISYLEDLLATEEYKRGKYDAKS